MARPLQTFEENRDSTGFDEWRSSTKLLVYMTHQLIDAESKQAADLK